MHTNTSIVLTGVLAGALAGLTVAGTAAADEIRIATLAPEGSSWMKILSKGAEEVKTKTDGRVVLKYYAGGVQGDERDAVRKMNLGQLDGVAVTAVGLSMIDESIRILELPRMFASVEELDYVADKMWPYFQKKFDAKGVKLQDRGDVGWVYFLSKKEIKSVSDLKSAKVWMWGDDTIVRATFKRLGVPGVPLGVPEVEPALTTGRIDACYGSPLAAMALQWNTKVKFITSASMNYGIAATVIKNDAYKKLGTDEPLFAKITRGMQKALRKQIRKDNDSAKRTMLRKGVKETSASDALNAELDKAAATVWKDLTGKMFTQAELDMVLKYRDEFRAKAAAP
ncbi:MAG TPA: TRAP transporter substrate-binding protein DctP [Kofleriaceae bacterium]|nr:TRAP transporter substrate-binding protein DctP [Kofleriaceae bacterium]